MPYTLPTADQFLDKFTEFEDADDEVVTALIAEAARQVDESWIEDDYQTAILYLTAHYLQLSGGAYDTGGLQSFSLGAISVTYADFAKQKLGELDTTSYGQRFAKLRRQNRGGPRVI